MLDVNTMMLAIETTRLVNTDFIIESYRRARILKTLKACSPGARPRKAQVRCTSWARSLPILLLKLDPKITAGTMRIDDSIAATKGVPFVDRAGYYFLNDS